MDQNYNSNQNEFLWTLLANPANDAHLYNFNLQRLVNDFPQSGILQALLAHSSDEKNLKQASVYFNARSLYKLINAPASLTGVPNEKIILQNNLNGSNSFTYQHHDSDNGASENYFSDHSAVETEVAEPVHAEDHQPVIAYEDAPSVIDEHHTGEPVAEKNEASVPAIDEHHTEGVVAEHHQGEAIPEHHIEETVPEHTIEEVLPEHHIEQFVSEISNNIPSEELITAPAIALVEPEISNHHQVEEPAENATADNHYTEEVAEQEIAQSHPMEESVEDKHETSEHDKVNNLPIEDRVKEQHPAVLSEATSEIQNAVPVVAPVENKVAEERLVAPQVPEPENEEPAPVNNNLSEITSAVEEKEALSSDQPKHIEEAIEDETFDEITGIENINIEAEIVNNIAAADYFMFDNAFSEQKEPENATITPETPGAKVASESKELAPSANDTEQQDLSKYHDEKMPYSFMWWLDKTRKEHASVYQPYLPSEAAVAINNTKPTADALQQQYYENIFHITSFEELDKGTITVSAPVTEKHDPKRKEDVIIERFIQEEPQIKPQSSDKLDNENKAKKSSEDRDEIVTETLAAIYSDQMLYHKAIASYKKLMLKFPEKSRYFASKIEQLEKKTN